MSLSPAQRAQLLDPAEAEFARHGYAGASLNRVLVAAGMSKGQAYHYVRDKADLYAATIERALQRLIEAVDYRVGEPTEAAVFWQRIEQLFARISQVLLSDERLAALACGIHESEATRAALDASQLSLRRLFTALIAHGQTLGAVRTDLPQSLLMDLLFALAVEVDRWFATHWSALDADEARRLNTRVIRMLRDLARPPAE
ncbi:TetR/AcrR family transcriptional regulator [Salinicola endophyticus]|uniref:TetR/AcrR family transcriptional regulator n=1 Tax=Salinicola endophyticus TaxID=1949083 RepID=A0AB74U9R3_9GAMM